MNPNSVIKIGNLGFEFVSVEFGFAGAILTGPIGGESAEIDLGPTRHLRDLLVVTIEGDSDNAGAFGGFHGDLRLERCGDDSD